ncbi:hypothetical protein P9112_010141 [Eukaryota sp. TZLM1-RC]
MQHELGDPFTQVRFRSDLFVDGSDGIHVFSINSAHCTEQLEKWFVCANHVLPLAMQFKSNGLSGANADEVQQLKSKLLSGFVFRTLFMAPPKFKGIHLLLPMLSRASINMKYTDLKNKIEFGESTVGLIRILKASVKSNTASGKSFGAGNHSKQFFHLLQFVCVCLKKLQARLIHCYGLSNIYSIWYRHQFFFDVFMAQKRALSCLPL